MSEQAMSECDCAALAQDGRLCELHTTIRTLQADVARLREALLEHRADLHGYSTRPCPTCRKSADALGLRGRVPDTCSRAEHDSAALAAAKEIP